MSTLRRALVLAELGLALDSEAIATIVDVDLDAPSAWLPSLVFGAQPSPADRRALQLADGGRVEVPVAMVLLESVEVLEVPALLRSIAARCGVIGLAVLPAGLALFCDPRQLAGAGHDS